MKTLIKWSLFILIGVFICAGLNWHSMPGNPAMPADVTHPEPTPYPTRQWSMISPEDQEVLDGKVKIPEGHHYLSEYLYSPEARALLDKASRKADLEAKKRYEELNKENESYRHSPEGLAILAKYGWSSYSRVTDEWLKEYDREHQVGEH
jgi:hypothetical protein